MFLRIAVLACVLSLAAFSNGLAQDSRHDLPSSQPSQQSSPNGFTPQPGNDEAILQALSERKGGLVIIDAAVNGRSCNGTRIFVARKGDDQLQTVAAAEGSRSILGTQIRFAGVMILAPGQYLVTRVNCANYTNYLLNGPFAQFHVNAGEVVNVGVLRLSTQLGGAFRSGIVRADGVGGMDPQARVRFKERIPRTYARLVERPMTLVSAAPRPASAPGGVGSSPAIPGETRY